MRLRPSSFVASAAALFAASCGTTSSPPASHPPPVTSADSAAAPMLVETARQAALRAAPRTTALPAPDELRRLDALIDSHYQRSANVRGYIMVDKPMYQPGETMWMRVDARAASTMMLSPTAGTLTVTDPKGGQLAQRYLALANGVAAADIELAPELPGGEYTISFTAPGASFRRSVIVAAYDPPRLKKTLELLRKAYGPGDTAAAAVEIFHTTGEPFAKKALTAIVTLDDAELIRLPVTTDERGRATVRFALPKSIARGDALLTVIADDSGLVESIQKRVPIVLSAVRVSMFPEGGDLVAGLPSRVYVAAENLLGKPADVDAVVTDDRGKQVASFSSIRDGMGRFELTPEAGRSYKLAITRPAGITQTFDLPAAQASGCVLTSLDDFTSRDATLDVAATCSAAQTAYVVASLRGKRVASAAIDVAAKIPAVLSLPVDKTAQGAVRVTLFAASAAAGGKAPPDPWQTLVATPVAERLVYRGRGQALKVEITADRPSYTPRQKVALRIKASDLAGKPVAASFGLSVVDDTVLALADDKTANVISHLYLEEELPAQPIEEPNFYFSDKPEAAGALDLLMGTKGYRRFDWQAALTPAPTAAASGMGDQDALADAPMPAAEPMPAPAAPPLAQKPRPARMPLAKNADKKDAKPMPIVARQPVGGKDAEKAKRVMRDMDDRRERRAAGRAIAQAEMDEEAGEAIAWGQPARVFPVPEYAADYAGPRSDFRETIFWTPDVRTAADGVATVTFPVSDAVTSFRVVAEGASLGGVVGRGEALIKSELPLSLDTKLPVEVAAGDTLSLPVSLTNKTDRAQTAQLDARFGAAFRLGARPAAQVTLAPGEKRTIVFPLEVVGQGGEGEVSIALTTAGLRDTVEKKIKVVPLGFPIEAAAAGTAKKGVVRHVFNTSGALPGTLAAQVLVYPSPLASMTRGTEAILREPSGCFEQTSSSNYPNVMAMQYMATGDVDPQIVQRAQDLMGRGYKLLTGYETKDKGYEWFGQSPGHEALTAYGLMEFEDMAAVHDEVDRKMIERTAAWLFSRRDGKGGFSRSSQALDSFGRANAATTDGYIVWALTEAKRSGLTAELEAQAKLGMSSSDPYLVALAANSLLNTEPKGRGPAIAARLAALQDRAGHFPGAKETITMSGGESLDIETTALAALALMKASPAGEHEVAVRNAIGWINSKRDGYGAFGSTQGTVLALKALARYADYSRRTQAAGVVILRVNGKQAKRIAFDKGEKAALDFSDLAPLMVVGENTLELEVEGEAQLPYSIAVSYRSAQPASSPDAKVSVTAQLAKEKVALGEGVRMTAELVNRSKDGIPMTLARLGIPAGLSFQTWQLKELRDKGVIDFYETGAREVIVYLRAMAPAARKTIELDLLATLPGHYVAPASSSYLYYTDEHKSWTAPLTVTVK